jgi:hypothetical protein
MGRRRERFRMFRHLGRIVITGVSRKEGIR